MVAPPADATEPCGGRSAKKPVALIIDEIIYALW
jgi:hypothetical protein